MERIRASRPTPGLRPQHLAAVRAAAAVCDADIEGDAIGSTELTVNPGPLRGGDYEVDVGTAGSVTLVFDAVLPFALDLEESLSLHAVGGTDVTWSPPADYFRFVKLPLMRRAGLAAAVDVDRRGFYPAGGGAATLFLAPSSMDPLDLDDRGPPAGARVYSVASAALADREVAERQAASAVEELTDADVPVEERTTTYAATDSPGSAVVVRLDFERSAAGFDALGERGVPAEDVGGSAAEAATTFVAEGAAVDGHLADQLLVFLALAGGRLRAPGTTPHVEASLDLLSAFGFDVELEGPREGDGTTLVGR